MYCLVPVYCKLSHSITRLTSATLYLVYCLKYEHITMADSESVVGIASGRLTSIKHIATLNDPTYTNVPLTLWTCAESVVVHICAAAPAIQCLLTKAAQNLRRLFRGKDRENSTRRFKPNDGQCFSANNNIPKSDSLTQLRHTEDLAKFTSPCNLSSGEWQ